MLAKHVASRVKCQIIRDILIEELNCLKSTGKHRNNYLEINIINKLGKLIRNN